MEEIDKLYDVVSKQGLYTKSKDEFISKYSNDTDISKLYDVVSKEGLYTKSKDDFYNKYFESLKKKEPSQQASQLSFQEKVSVLKSPPKSAYDTLVTGQAKQVGVSVTSAGKPKPKPKADGAEWTGGAGSFTIGVNQEYKNRADNYIKSTRPQQSDIDKAKQDVDSEWNNQGIWNNVKRYAGSAAKIASSIGSLTSIAEGITGGISKMMSDAPGSEFEYEKKMAKKQLLLESEQAKKDGGTPPIIDNTTIAQRTKANLLEKKINSITESKERDYLIKAERNVDASGLSEKDKIERFDTQKVNTLRHIDRVELQKQNILRPAIEESIKDLNQSILKANNFVKAKTQVPPELLEEINQKQQELKLKEKITQDSYNKFLSNRKELGTFEHNLDVVRRDYNWGRNLVNTFGATTIELMSGMAAIPGYSANIVENIVGKNVVTEAFKKQSKWESELYGKEAEELRNEIAKPISIEDIDLTDLSRGVSDFGDWFRNTFVASQAPILGATLAGGAGFAAIGSASAGNAYTAMQKEVEAGTAEYTPWQLAAIPAAHGGIDSVQAIVESNLLKGAGRTLASASVAQRELIAEGMFKPIATKLIKAIPHSNAWFAGITMSKNILTKYGEGKEDVQLTDGLADSIAMATAMGGILPVFSHVISEKIVKPFRLDNKISKLSDSILVLENELKDTSIDPIIRTEKESLLDNKRKAISTLLVKQVKDIKSLSNEQFTEVLDINKEQSKLRDRAAKAKEAADPNDTKSTQDILDNLAGEFKVLEQRRVKILQKGPSILLEQLNNPEYVTELKTAAENKLVKEAKDKGKTEVKFTDDEISREAITMHNEKIAIKKGYEDYNKRVAEQGIKPAEEKVWYYNEDAKRGPIESAPETLPEGYTSAKKIENSVELERWKNQTEVTTETITKEKEIEQLREQERLEKEKVYPNDKEKLDEIYDKYDKLISPLLRDIEGAKAEVTPTEKTQGTPDVISEPIDLEVPKPKVEDVTNKTDIELEDRYQELDEKGFKEFTDKERDEFNAIEKEQQKREWKSIVDAPINKVKDILIDLKNKLKEGKGVFVEKWEVNAATKAVDRYSNPSKLTDKEILKDFSDALKEDPTKRVDSAILFRESFNEASKRGLTMEDLLKEPIERFTRDGYSKETAREIVSKYLEPVLKGAKEEVTPTEKAKVAEVVEPKVNVRTEKEAVELVKDAEENNPIKINKTVNTSEEGLKHASKVGGVPYELEGGIGLIQGFNTFGDPIYSAYKNNSRTNVDVDSFNNSKGFFTEEQIKSLRELKKELLTTESKNELESNNPFEQQGRVASSDSVPGNIKGFVKSMTDSLGIKKNIFVITDADFNESQYKKHGLFGNLAQIRSAILGSKNPFEFGSKRYMSKADAYYIYYDGKLNGAEILTVVAHETGHILEQELFKNASEETKKSIKEDYDKWVSNLSGKTLKEVTQETRDITIQHLFKSNEVQFNKDTHRYISSFPEYFADNVAKWIRSSEKPKTIIDEFFSEVAKKLKDMHEYVFKTGNYSKSIFNFLDGVHEASKVEEMVYEKAKPTEVVEPKANNEIAELEKKVAEASDKTFAAQKAFSEANMNGKGTTKAFKKFKELQDKQKALEVDLQEAKDKIKAETKAEVVEPNEAVETKKEQLTKEVDDASKALKDAYNAFKTVGFALDPKQKAAQDLKNQAALNKALIDYGVAKLKKGTYEFSEFVKDLKAEGLKVSKEFAKDVYERIKSAHAVVSKKESGDRLGIKRTPAEEQAIKAKIDKAYELGAKEQKVISKEIEKALKLEAKETEAQAKDALSAQKEVLGIEKAEALSEQGKKFKEQKESIKQSIKDKIEKSKDAIKNINQIVAESLPLDKLSKVQVKSILNNAMKIFTYANVENGVSNFIDHVDKVINNIDHVRNLENLETLRKKSFQNLLKAKVSPSLILTHLVSKVLSIKPEHIPSEVMSEYTRILDKLGDNADKRIQRLISEIPKAKGAELLKKQAELKELKENQIKDRAELIQMANKVMDAFQVNRNKVVELSDSYNSYIENNNLQGETFSKVVKKMEADDIITETEADLMRSNSDYYVERKAREGKKGEVLEQRESLTDRVNQTLKSLNSPEGVEYRKNSLDRESILEANKVVGKVTKEYLDSLSDNELETVLNVLNALDGGLVSASLRKVANGIDLFEREKAVTPILSDAKLKWWEGAKSTIKAAYYGIKGDKVKSSVWYHKLQGAHNNIIDTVVNNLKNNDLYKNTSDKAAKLWGQSKTYIDINQNKYINPLSNLIEKQAKGDSAEVMKSNIKTSLYLYQKMHDSSMNKGKDIHVEEYVKTANKNKVYSDETLNEINSALEKFKEKDFDVDRWYNEELTDSERKVVDGIRDFYDSDIKEKAKSTSYFDDGRLMDTSNPNYVPVDFAFADNSDVQIDNLIKNKTEAFYNPSMKAGNLMDKAGSSGGINKSLNLTNPFKTMETYLTDVSTQYHMMNEVRIQNQLYKKLLANESFSKSSLELINAMKAGNDKVVSSWLENAYKETGFWGSVFDKRITKQLLSGFGKFAAEGVGNAINMVNHFGEVSEGIKIINDNALSMEQTDSAMYNLGISQAYRFIGKALSIESPFKNQGGVDMPLTRKLKMDSNMPKEYINMMNNLYKRTKTKAVLDQIEMLHDALRVTPDKSLSKPLALGIFQKRFQSLSGKLPNWEKISSGDAEYMSQNKEFIDVAVSSANVEASLVIGSQNPYEKAGKQLITKDSNAYSKANGFFQGYSMAQGSAFQVALKNLLYNGAISKVEASIMVAQRISSQAAYLTISKGIQKGLLATVGTALGYTLFKDDEEEEGSTKRNVVASAVQLAMSRTGAVGSNLAAFAFEKGSEQYGQGVLYEGEYTKGKATMFSAYDPKKTAGENFLNVGLQSMGQRWVTVSKGKEVVTDFAKGEWKTGMFDVAGSLGYIPLYKDVNSVVGGLKYQGLPSKEMAQGMTSAEQIELEEKKVPKALETTFKNLGIAKKRFLNKEISKDEWHIIRDKNKKVFQSLLKLGPIDDSVFENSIDKMVESVGLRTGKYEGIEDFRKMNSGERKEYLYNIVKDVKKGEKIPQDVKDKVGKIIKAGLVKESEVGDVVRYYQKYK